MRIRKRYKNDTGKQLYREDAKTQISVLSSATPPISTSITTYRSIKAFVRALCSSSTRCFLAGIFPSSPLFHRCQTLPSSIARGGLLTAPTRSNIVLCPKSWLENFLGLYKLNDNDDARRMRNDWPKIWLKRFWCDVTTVYMIQEAGCQSTLGICC